jgi:hypothetical protein
MGLSSSPEAHASAASAAADAESASAERAMPRAPVRETPSAGVIELSASAAVAYVPERVSVPPLAEVTREA